MRYKFNRHQLDEIKFVKSEDSLRCKTNKQMAEVVLPIEYKEFDVILSEVFNKNLVSEYLDTIENGDIVRDYFGIGRDKVHANDIASKLGIYNGTVKARVDRTIDKLKYDKEFKNICIKSFGE